MTGLSFDGGRRFLSDGLQRGGVAVLTMESIREFIRREPFEPFVIRLSNGEAHEILHPECVAITKSKVVITYHEEDRVVHCSLIHVNAVELLQRA